MEIEGHGTTLGATRIITSTTTHVTASSEAVIPLQPLHYQGRTASLANDEKFHSEIFLVITIEPSVTYA